MLSIHSANPNMVSKPVTLKLFINKKSGKVLYAEAGKDFVDFLLSLLMLPFGFLVKLVQKDSMVGSMGNLSASIKILRDNCIQTGKKKLLNMLLKSTPPFVPFGPNPPRLWQNDAKGDSMKFYTCSNNHKFFTDFCGAPCRQCKVAMTTECIYVANDGASSSSVGGGGFVKDSVTYAVTDDLEVMPFKTEALNHIRKKYGLKDTAKTEVKDVEVAEAEALAIMKASLKSKTVLTDAFPDPGKKA